MNPHFAIKDLESVWPWIGREPRNDQQGEEVAMVKCNVGPAIKTLEHHIERLMAYEERYGVFDEVTP